MWRLLIVAGCILAVGLSTTGCGPNKNDYVERNESLIETLPTFPESSVVRTTSSEYREDEHSPVGGYTTNVVYQVPADVTRENVIEFYLAQLSDWTYELEEFPVSSGGVVKVANFRNGDSGVQVNTDGLFPTNYRMYELSVDYLRYQDED